MKSSRGPERRWILDDGPFNDLADFAPLGRLSAYPAGKLLVAGQTARDAWRSERRKAMLDVEAHDGERLIEVIKVRLGNDDPAGAILLELHGEEATTTNLAEREAIAWSLVHGKDAVFVTYDSRAAITALAELGIGKVAHPFDLWMTLLGEDMILPVEFKDLCERSRNKGPKLRRIPTRVTDLLRDRS